MLTRCLVLEKCSNDDLRALARDGFEDAARAIDDRMASALSSSVSRPTLATGGSGPFATVDAGFGRATLSVACRFRPSIADREHVNHAPTSSDWDGFDVNTAG